MTGRNHSYAVTVTWTGNRGQGTTHYRAYDRSYRLEAPGKPALTGSADPAFLGDAAHWNPEELMVAALSACHKLWYLHLCADAGVVVTAYCDEAAGEMQEVSGGGGAFTQVVLRPQVRVAAAAQIADAERLHAEAAGRCFIKNSVNFPVHHEPTVTAES
jgi:organic hydroperoxide reductase OsmC/OhrA